MKLSKPVLIPGLIACCAIVGFIVLAIAGGGKQYASLAPAMADSKTLVRASSHMTGVKEAAVTLVEFGDYQCPACAATYRIVKQALAAYRDPKAVNFVFRNFPLPQHGNARVAAEAAEAASAQGKFWEMHDKLYENQAQWSDSADPVTLFIGYVRDAGLDAERFAADVRASRFEDVIQADMNDGTAVSVQATPTFFINGHMQVGIPDAAGLKALIDGKIAPPAVKK